MIALQHLFSTVKETPDLYLDELRMELLETCGVSVSESTIWRTLIKGGYTMKKVCSHCYSLIIVQTMNSYLVRRLSAAKRSEPNLLFVSGHMSQTSLFLWTRVLLTAERHTVDEHGQYVAGRLLGRPFSVEDDGEFCKYYRITTLQLRLYLYQVLRPSCVIPRRWYHTLRHR